MVFGGYTKTGWWKNVFAKQFDEDWRGDKDAFLFFIKSPHCSIPFISNIKQDEKSISKALGYSTDTFGNFGKRWAFYIKDQRFYQQDNGRNNNYELFGHKKEYITGSDYYNIG